jgi:hypothetical protein
MGNFNWRATSLTWQGHEFLDSVRRDTVWQKVKLFVAEKGGLRPVRGHQGAGQQLREGFSRYRRLSESPALGYCAWCAAVIQTFCVDDHGTRYHVACGTLRRAVVNAWAEL